MDAAKKFSNGEFRIECGQMVLYSQGNPPIANGPGEIWQDEEGRLQYKISVNQAAYLAILAFINKPRGIGQIIPPEDYLTLEAQSHALPIWVSPSVFPGLSGGIFAGGLAGGSLPELIYTTDIAAGEETCAITVRLKGTWDFPCNLVTETVFRVGGQDRASTQALNGASFEVEGFKFELLQDDKHTIFSLVLPAHEMTPYLPMRMVEALQFVLGRELSMMATEIVSAGKHFTRLISPYQGKGKIYPPLQFQKTDEGGNIWRMFCNYFMHIRAHPEPRWHPISRNIGGFIESSSSSISAQALALGVAIEGLAGDCFQELAPANPQLLEDIKAAEKALNDLKLASNPRILGSLNAMKKARNSDIVREFVAHKNLDKGLFEAWRKLRNSSTHGDADAHEIAELLKLQSEALTLLHSMVFEAIGYTGPRTDYSLPNWPKVPWPIPPNAPIPQ